MRRASLTDRLHYAFDNVMSKGAVAMIVWLALITVVVTLVLSLIVVSTGIVSRVGFVDQFWEYLALTLDADAMTDQPWLVRLAGLVVTFTGVFVTSILVGILATGIDSRIAELRKGRSKVIEEGHTVILGWSPKVFPVLSELLVANANKPRACIVVLGNRDQVDMEDEIRDRVGSTGRTRIVCRRGSPMDMSDLEIVSLHTARSIIILAPEGGDPDSSVIKTLLAITNNPRRRPEPYHVVAEIRIPKNLDAARFVGGEEAELLLTGVLIARVAAQTCRQSGLSAVYAELMDFAGDEIYFQEERELIGKTFGEALLAYEDSAVMGLCTKGGSPKLNPAMDTRIQEGDQIIAISEDDDTVVLSGLADVGIDDSVIRVAPPAEAGPEQVLILGWNWRVPFIIDELAHYVAPGSSVTVMADFSMGEAQVSRDYMGSEGASTTNLSVTVQEGDTTDRGLLDGLPFDTFDHVVLLAYSDALDPQRADARTLITLLHLRDIAETMGHSFSIVSEMMDIRNRQLAEVMRPDDFVVSDRLVSLILSQISENKRLGAVFTDLFDPQGAEIYLKPVGDYVEPGPAVSFYTVVEAARRRGEVALGYRVQARASDADSHYGVLLNPDKSNPITFSPQDRVIVLAEA